MGRSTHLDFQDKQTVYFEWGTTTAYGGTTTPQTKAGREYFRVDVR
ncbi:MAG: hypothetical protein MPW15_00105 [Candidatus Manganitrophus sp.]|nr:hypothetical protein [Candidatus Manganitrophus sp.]